LNLPVNFSLNLLGVCLLGACAAPREPLVVKQFVLRDQVTRTVEDPLVRMESSRRLYGAVSMEERRGRFGHYYTMIWSDPEGVGRGEVELRFEYQQGATGSRVKQRVLQFPASEAEGTAEFAIIGEDYFQGGRVLTWKTTLLRGNTVLATRQSYLWQ
jgi:hypothetical protein